MFNSLINLIQRIDSSVDEYGDRVVTETSRDIFAQVSSIGMKEFYQAQALGFQPEIKFILADYYDYQDEPIVVYESVRYRVLRTFRDGQRLEIVCTREVNTSDGST